MTRHFALCAAILLLMVSRPVSAEKLPAEPAKPEAPKVDEVKPIKEPIKLEWKWKKGDKLEVKFTDKRQMTRSADEALISKEQTVYTLAHEVTDVDATGVATVTLKYEQITYYRLDAKGETNWDSSNQPPPDKIKPNAKIGLYLCYLNQILTLKVAASGEVKSLTGMNAIMDRVKIALKGTPGEAATIKILDKCIIDSVFKDQLCLIYGPLPGKAAKTGDTWKQNIEVNQPTSGVTKQDLSFTLSGVVKREKDELVKVGLKIVQDFEAEEGGGYKDYDVAAVDKDMGGEILFSQTKGRVHSAKRGGTFDFELAEKKTGDKTVLTIDGWFIADLAPRK
ncbi:MAG: hypothetical protein IT462_03430 [Planctomycetes bacterium]|nr:hypothetical protein [Planctomycetota bacterium]